MYPFSSSSVRNFCTASSSTRFIGYTLQSTASGASFLNSIAWSQALFGGYHFDSSSLNTLANCRYSAGTSTFFVYCCALIASSVEVVACTQQSSFICAIIGFFPGTKGLTDQRIMGSSFSWINPFFHVNGVRTQPSRGILV